MLKFVDDLLNRISMYRMMLYFLITLILASIFLSIFGYLPYSAILIIYSGIFITLICILANKSLARFFNVPFNFESVFITAFILVLLITPPGSFFDTRYLILASTASLWAISSKYILVFRRKHIFNPAAFGVLLSAIVLERYASWWVGNERLAILVFLGGILILRKIQVFDMVLSFLLVVALMIFLDHPSFASFANVLWSTILYSPLLFFTLVMLTEPQTTPPKRISRIAYGLIVGFLYMSSYSLGHIFSTPELALVIGNIFSFVVSPKGRYVMSLKEKSKIANETYEFVFESNRNFTFKPGQYLEWTLPNNNSDRKGNRRYFTIASSPTENDILIGVKIDNPGSSFKQFLGSLLPGEKMYASNLLGEFTLPANKEEKLVFIAGGIGVTPFRSMLKYLLDKNEKREIVMFYSCRNKEDFAFVETLSAAESVLKIKIVYIITNTRSIPENWNGEIGYLNSKIIAKYVPDLHDRVFYISGPRSMVVNFEEVLKNLRVKEIKTDFFSGYL